MSQKKTSEETVASTSETFEEITEDTGTTERTAEASSSDAEEYKDKYPIISALQTSPFYSEVSALAHWKDPIQSGLIFGIGNFFFFLITYGEYSVLTLFSYLLFTLLLVCYVYVNVSIFLKKAGNPFSKKLEGNEFRITRKMLEGHLDTIAQLLNDVLYIFRSTFYFTNTLRSLKFAGILFALATIGKCFSGIAILFLVFFFSFVIPRIYLEKQKEIDAILGLARSQIDTYTQLVLSKIPFPGKKKSE